MKRSTTVLIGARLLFGGGDLPAKMLLMLASIRCFVVIIYIIATCMFGQFDVVTN